MKSILTCLALAVGLLCVADRSYAAVIVYDAQLSGAAEFPPVATPGTGEVRVVIDTLAHTMQIDASFADLIGTTTAAHIHAPTATPFAGTVAVATQTPSFVGFPLGVTSGSFSTLLNTLAGTTYNAAFIAGPGGGTVAGAEAALFGALAEGRAYFNIHTTFAGSGEIRGFLAPVPLPAGALLTLTALAALGALGARRRVSA